jgi:hypothetical protein
LEKDLSYLGNSKNRIKQLINEIKIWKKKFSLQKQEIF